jgi:hypothetical protein
LFYTSESPIGAPSTAALWPNLAMFSPYLGALKIETNANAFRDGGGRWCETAKPPLVKKMRGGVNYFRSFCFTSARAGHGSPLDPPPPVRIRRASNPSPPASPRQTPLTDRDPIADRYDKILRPRFIKRNRERTGQDPSKF